MKKYKRFVFVLLLIGVLVSGCIMETADNGNTSGNETTDGGAPAITPTQGPTEPGPVDDDGSTASDGPADTAVTSADCPATNGTLVSFIHPGHGYCFLVPSGHSSSVFSDSVTFIGKTYGEMEPLAPSFKVFVEPAAGQTALELTNAASAAIGMGEEPKEITLGGQTGYLLNQIPGRLPAVSVYLVYNDLAYRFTSEPLDIIAVSESEPFQDALEFWELFKSSFTLFDPIPAAMPQANLENCTLDAEFVADLTIPDGTIVVPGEYLIKKWLIRNNGTCDWGAGFEFYQTNLDSQLLSQLSVSDFPMAAPGVEVEVSVALRLSDTANPGEHIARFAMRTGDGQSFGATPYVQVVLSSTASSGCVTESINGAYWYVNEDVGVCFTWVTAEFVVDSPDLNTVTLKAPREVDCGCDDVDVTLTITKLGNMPDIDLQYFLAQQLAAWGVPEIPPTISDIEIGGYPAILVEGLGLPGPIGTNEAYVLVDGVGYKFHLIPGAWPDSVLLWDVVEGSFNFFQ